MNLLETTTSSNVPFFQGSRLSQFSCSCSEYVPSFSSDFLILTVVLWKLHHSFVCTVHETSFSCFYFLLSRCNIIQMLNIWPFVSFYKIGQVERPFTLNTNFQKSLCFQILHFQCARFTTLICIQIGWRYSVVFNEMQMWNIFIYTARKSEVDT